jgi:hypothetical protein
MELVRITYLLKSVYYYYYYYYYYGSTALCWALAGFSVSQSYRLLWRQTSRSQGLYLHTEQHKHKINAQRHPCLEWFEPTIPVFQRAKTVNALDRAASVIAMVVDSTRKLIRNLYVLFYYFLCYTSTIHRAGPRYNGSDVPRLWSCPQIRLRMSCVVQISVECFRYSIRQYCNSPCCNVQARRVKSIVLFE